MSEKYSGNKESLAKRALKIAGVVGAIAVGAAIAF
jgi:hypothetical protein